MSQQVQPRRAGRQKRARVPDSQRKRAARACLPCRQHKEKCTGGVPCARCQQYTRTCQYDNSRPQTSRSADVPQREMETEAFQISDREHSMVRIIKHFMGDISFSASNLQDIADKLENDHPPTEAQGDASEDHNSISESYALEPLSTNTMHYSGELSHWNFSRTIRSRLRSLGDGGEDPETKEGFFRAIDLQSTGSFVSSSLQYFPPRNIAEFLTDTFLDFAQTNYFYFDERTFREKMGFYYSIERPLVIDDAGWICTLLMTFAIGTQFACMQTKPTTASRAPSSEKIADDKIGLELYRFCCRLIPDLITTASVETVQAFLLLGVYTLPIDTSGLAYTYYGLAIKMAIQNGMHRKFSMASVDPSQVELHNRLWWSAYSLESRISILHGRPVSVKRVDTDAELPTDLPALQPLSGISNLPNITANIHLTDELEKLAEVILCLRRSPNRQGEYLKQLMAIRNQLYSWWTSLPDKVHCRDLTPTGPLFRCNVHLELAYATAIIYMGRPFILSQKKSRSSEQDTMAMNPGRADMVNLLSRDCIDAAVRIIELCQLLQGSVGLSRISYTEFSACRVALLALVAQQLNKSSAQTRNAVAKGMALIRQMSVGLESARSEVAVIEALEKARQQLDSRNDPERSSASSGSSYDQFKQWAELWNVDTTGTDAVAFQDTLGLPLQNADTAPSFDGYFSSFPQELNAFAVIPGPENDFELSGIWPNELQAPFPDYPDIDQVI